MAARQLLTCKTRGRHRGPPELKELPSWGGFTGEASSSFPSLLRDPSPEQDARALGGGHGHPADGGLDSQPQPGGQSVLAGLVWPCCGSPAGTAACLPCIPLADPYRVFPSVLQYRLGC